MTRACQAARAIGLRFMAGEGIEQIARSLGLAPLAVEEQIRTFSRRWRVRYTRDGFVWVRAGKGGRAC